METTATPATPTSTPTAAAGKPAPAPRPLGVQVQPDKGGYVWGTGRRKTAVARVRIKPGDGKITVNGRPLDEFFSELRDRQDVTEPLKATNTLGKLDVFARVDGGGYMGQAGAMRLGIARALKGYDPTLEPTLRDGDFLTRDPRQVERKKPGQPGARKRFQFSKR